MAASSSSTPKDEILERYLNTVYLGNNAYGLQAAAETYFGKNVDQLDVWEGAFLAGLIRNPSGYDPLAHPERARARFKQAVRAVWSTVGKVTEDQAKQAGDAWPLPTKQLSTPQTAVAPLVLHRGGAQAAPQRDHDPRQRRPDPLQRAVPRRAAIYTTLDPDHPAGRPTRPWPTSSPPTPRDARFQAALAAEDARTGAVVAMVGGRGFDQSQVNLAVTPRQTGSSAKLFILLAALQAGVQPNDTIDGTLPCSLPNPGSTQPFLIHDGVSRGVDTVATMTALSINCAYAKLSQIVGLNRVVDTAHRLGVKSDIAPIAAFATGGNEISPLDFATSRAPRSPTQGVRHDAYYIDRIEGPDGEIVYQHQDPGTQAVPTEVADTAINTLKGVIKNGTVESSSKKFLGDPAGGRQDRDLREQHQRHLRRLHHAAVGRRLVGQPAGQRHGRHAQHPGVPRRGGEQRPRRQPAVPDLGAVHRQGQRSQGLPGGGLAGGAEAAARVEAAVPAGHGVPLHRMAATAPPDDPTATPTARRAPASTRYGLRPRRRARLPRPTVGERTTIRGARSSTRPRPSAPHASRPAATRAARAPVRRHAAGPRRRTAGHQTAGAASPPDHRPRRSLAPLRQRVHHDMTDLHALLVLQHQDTAVDQLRHRRATLPERALVVGLEAELARLAAELAAATAERDRAGRRPDPPRRRGGRRRGQAAHAGAPAGRPPACPARRRR